MGRLFGTDGARGVANTEITCELAMEIGRAAAMVLTKENQKKPRVLIGMDTRASSEMLESAISAGLCSVGADVMLLGEIPTPAVAFLVRQYEYDAAVMISASHNPCEYNGIKIFQGNGYKLPDALEEEIESIILDKSQIPPVKIGGDVGRITRSKTAVNDYIEYLLSIAEEDTEKYNIDSLSNLKIAVDCSNGAASVTAPDLFLKLCPDALFINAHPNGTNINENCGSTHLDSLSDFVVRNNCDVGLAFDGDADRFLAIDENGNEVDGDKLLSIFSKYMKSKGDLKNNTVVVTVMSNMGFFKFCEANSLNCEKTKVGDRYVLENMLQGNYSLGGEQSGHIIFLDHSTTGDGELSALKLLLIMKATNKKLSFLASEMKVYPQVLKNIRVSDFGKARFPHDEEIKNAINSAEKELGSNGRVLVRVSGTEPLIRVMLEGIDENKIKVLADELVDVIKERLL
ncbi:MAG: phosphoglucosamine mutase [Clostridia bacterium]|nr:phosphoglucosamine mutase [Clostridia bacterium]MBR3810133.1 phosphoglucosamine mutase [Clostridia bacterium]